MAERRVAVLVPNLFLRAPVDDAVRAAGAVPVGVSRPDDPAVADCAAVIADLAALGDDPAAAAELLASHGARVMVFGPHVEGDRLAAVRRSGALVLPRGAFLARLPELLAEMVSG